MSRIEQHHPNQRQTDRQAGRPAGWRRAEQEAVDYLHGALTAPRTGPSDRPAAGPAVRSAEPRHAKHSQPVTEGNSEVGSSEFEGAAGEREGRSEPDATRKSAFTDRDRWVGRLDRARSYLIPPAVLTQPPATVAELAAYARTGAWTRRRSGMVRAAGVWWFRLVGLPYTVVCRYGEWVAQRPGRAIPVLLFVKVMASTSWGGWTVEHLIEPASRAAIWLFL
jgi:hypothetical protein